MHSNKTILIVDDDADFAEALSSFLEANGYQVLQARDGSEGLQAGQGGAPRPDPHGHHDARADRGLLHDSGDPPHPGPGGHTHLRRLSSIYSQIPGFRITPEASWLAHDDFFAKPVDPPQLLEKIRERLAAAGP